MTFDTLWAGIVEAIEVRTGQDLTKGLMLGLSLEDVRGLLKMVYELGVTVGQEEKYGS